MKSRADSKEAKVLKSTDKMSWII